MSHIIRAPLWLAQLVTGAKSFRDNPVIGSYRLNQMGLHALRRSSADRLGALRRRRLASPLTAAEQETFENQGYVVRKHALDEGLFRALRREAENLKVVAREMRQGGTVTRRIGLDRNLLMTLPALRSVIEDASIRSLIHYAGSHAGEPTFQIQSVIAAAGPNIADPQTSFHADTFHPTAKAWLFLDDVAEDGGQLGLGGQVQVVGDGADSVGAQPDLLGRLLPGDVQDAPGGGGGLPRDGRLRRRGRRGGWCIA